MIQYQPGSSNPADYLSRHPSLPSHQLNDQSSEHYINVKTYHAAPKSISIDQIGNETSRDITLQQVIESIQTTALNIYNHSTQYITNSVFTTKSY